MSEQKRMDEIIFIYFLFKMQHLFTQWFLDIIDNDILKRKRRERN